MSNVHDILGVQKKAQTVEFGGAKAKAKAKKKRVPRELANLGENAVEIALSIKKEVEEKKKDNKKRIRLDYVMKNKWHRKTFAVKRDDSSFKPTHWSKVSDTDEHFFLKNDKSRDVFKCRNEEEFNRVVLPLDPRWTYQDHTTVWNHVGLFNGYFLPAWDRLPDSLLALLPTVDDLKERFFKVVRRLLISRGDKSNPLVVKPYDPEADRQRRAMLDVNEDDLEEEARLKALLEAAKAEEEALDLKIKALKKTLGVSAKHNATAALEKKRKLRLAAMVGQGEEVDLAEVDNSLHALRHHHASMSAVSHPYNPSSRLISSAGALTEMVTGAFTQAGLAITGPSLVTDYNVKAHNALLLELAEISRLKAQYHNNVLALLHRVQAVAGDDAADKIERSGVQPIGLVSRLVPGLVKVSRPQQEKAPKAKGKAKAKSRAKKSDADED